MRTKTLLLCSLLVATSALAQDPATGFPPYGSFQDGRFDAVNRQNLNVNFSIPVVSYPGRGLSFSFAITYDSLIWRRVQIGPSWYWQPMVDVNGVEFWGWKKEPSPGTFKWSSTTEYCDPKGQTNNYTGYSFTDPSGTRHDFNLNFFGAPTPCNFPTQPRTGYAIDGSGYYIDAALPNQPKVRTPDGKLVTHTGTVTDTNGNFISKIVVGSTETHWKDTLGRIALKLIKRTTCADLVSPVYPECWDYKYTAVDGSEQKLTLFMSTFTVTTSFACTIVNYSQSGKLLPEKIKLANGLFYSFTYELNGAAITGRLKRVTLPTGGYYEYEYPSGGGLDCANGNVTTLTRRINDASSTVAWDYSTPGLRKIQAPQVGTNPRNETTLLFDGIGRILEEKIYQGAEGGTPMRTIVTTWAGNGTPSSTTTILEDGQQQSKTETTFDSYGNLTQLVEYDWGTGFPGPAIRTTQTTYLSTSAYASLNIRNRSTQVMVRAGGPTGTIMSQTDIAYDGSTNFTGPNCIGGASQHNDTAYGCNFLTRGNPISITRYANAATQSGALTQQLQYDSLGNLRQVTDSGNHPTSFTYDDSWASPVPPECVLSAPTYAQVTTVANALNHTTTTKYHACTSAVASATDPNNQTTSFSYDVYGRPTQTNLPDGGQATVAYNDGSSPINVVTTTKISASQNLVAAVEFDGLGRVTRQRLDSDPAGVVYSDVSYDELGRQRTVSNPYRTGETVYLTKYKYDALNRVVRMIPPDGNESSDSNVVKYTYTGNATTVADQANKQRMSETDALGRLIRVWEPDGTGALNIPTRNQYDALDNLLCVHQKGTDTTPDKPCDDASVPATWRPRKFTYDSLSRPLTASTPEAGTVTNAYQATGDGLLSTITDARGITTTLAYDALHRVTLKDYSDATLDAHFDYDASSWAYPVQNPKGRLVQGWTSNDGTANMQILSYDAMGRVIQQWDCRLSQCPHSTLAAYDLAGNLTSLTYPSGRVVSNTYNTASRLTRVRFESFPNNSYNPYNYDYMSNPSYSAVGALTSWTMGNGLTETVSYNKRLQPVDVQIPNPFVPGGYFVKRQHGFNLDTANNGNVTSIADLLNASKTRTYAYDPLNRVAAMTSTPTNMSWEYDEWGNRKKQILNGQETTWGYAASNRHNDPGFQFDAAGNMTAQPGGTTFEWDAESRMKSINTNGPSYTYDAHGQRTRKVAESQTTEYIYFGGQVLAEKDVTAGGWSDYIYAGGRRIAKSDTWEDRIRTYGTYCSGCPWQWSIFWFPSAAGLNGYVIQSGDKLYLRQYQTGGVRGGPGLWFTDGTYTGNVTYDQDGYVSNGDAFQGWHHRRIDLAPVVGKTVNGVGLITEGWTPPGYWEIYYQDIALVSADGTVRQIWSRQTSASLTINGSPESTRGYDINRDPGGYGTDYARNNTTYYHGDHLASSRLMTSPQGHPIWQASYLPFGEEEGSQPVPAGQHFKFTGLERDQSSGEAGLDNTWFRKYSALCGRWLSPDPLGGSTGNPQTLNRYAYVANNPLNYVDPLGLEMLCQDWELWFVHLEFVNGIVVSETWTFGGYLLFCSEQGRGGGGGGGGGKGSFVESFLKALKNPDCAALLGGESNAKKILDKMNLIDVTASGWKPRDAADRIAAAAVNDSNPGGLITIATTGANRVSASTKLIEWYFSPWNGGTYRTWVGTNFQGYTQSQQLNVLMHEMMHVHLMGKPEQIGLDVRNPITGAPISNSVIKEKCGFDIPTYPK